MGVLIIQVDKIIPLRPACSPGLFNALDLLVCESDLPQRDGEADGLTPE
jgi:hypothetical protein